jgi:hypothetical protein
MLTGSATNHASGNCVNMFSEAMVSLELLSKHQDKLAICSARERQLQKYRPSEVE